MKKLLSILLVVMLVATFAVGCGTTDNGDNGDNGTTYTDGVYFAQEEGTGSGWKYFVVVTVEGGEITDAHWGGTNIEPSGNKYTVSAEGNYNMGGASEWYEQADAAAAWLIENQDPAAFDDMYTDDEGHTDALETDDGTQVSIHVIEFFDLVKEALAGEPVPEGTYTTPEDYVATAVMETAEGDEWQYKLDLIIVNGTIVDSSYNASYIGEYSEDTAKYFRKDAEGNPNPESPSSKVELGEDYGMDWKGNAAKIDEFVEANQGFEVEYIDDDGHTDTITGVSIHVNEYEDLFNQALGQ